MRLLPKIKITVAASIMVESALITGLTPNLIME
jgi:hypothetical protein